jgi:hypothetical protein
MRLAPLLVVVAALTASASSACSNTDDTEVLPPVVLGMEGDLAPTYDDGQTQIYQVQDEVRLNFRRLEEGERPQGQAPPYGRPPFHVASQSRITVRYTITNLDDAQHTVELLVDPWNEFVRYVPGVQQDEEETIPNFSGIDKFFVVPGKGRVEGIFTPDDMVELAVDLTTAMRIADAPPPDESAFAGAGLYNRAFNIQNRSSEPDPVLAPFMPLGPVAAIIGFDLGIRTYEQAKIAVELVIDVEDLEGNRLVEDGTDDRRLGPPGDTLTPPATPMR